MHLARVLTLLQAEDDDAATGWVDRPLSGDVASLRCRPIAGAFDRPVQVPRSAEWIGRKEFKATVDAVSSRLRTMRL